MTEINVKGDIVDNDTANFYDFFEMEYTSPKKIQDVVKNSNDDITLNIASNGGDVFAASEIYTLLKGYSNGKIIAKVQGLAASAASVITMAADQVDISPTAQIMIHRASTMFEGNADDLQHSIDVLNGIDKSIAAAYENKTHIDQGELLNMMSKETWLTAKDAVAYGFADSIMFVDEKKPAFINSMQPKISPEALNKFKTMQVIANEYQSKLKEPKKSDQKVETEDKESQLFKAKLAILLHKNGGA